MHTALVGAEVQIKMWYIYSMGKCQTGNAIADQDAKHRTPCTAVETRAGPASQEDSRPVSNKADHRIPQSHTWAFTN